MDDEHKINAKEVDGVEKPPRARVEEAGGEPVVAPSPFEQQQAMDESAKAAGSDTATTGESAAQKLDRKRDYLEGFLSEKPKDAPAGEAGGALQEAVVERLKGIYDPEIPVNIYDLGLIYGVDISTNGEAIVTMTLTTPHCPVAESMPGEVEMQVNSVPGVSHAEVNLVWDPPWDPEKMSDEAKLELGML